MNLLERVLRYAHLLSSSERDFVEELDDRDTDSIMSDDFLRLQKLKGKVDIRRAGCLDEAELSEMAQSAIEAIEACGGWHTLEGGKIAGIIRGESVEARVVRWDLLTTDGSKAATIIGERQQNGSHEFKTRISYEGLRLVRDDARRDYLAPSVD